MVVLGVDTHKDVHVAAVLDITGRLLGTEAFAASTHGYEALSSWARSHGQVSQAGVEGTGSYGAGLARKSMRRSRRKTDAVDAEAAARAVLSGRAQVRRRCRRSAARLQTRERLSDQVPHLSHQPYQSRAGLRRSPTPRGSRRADQQRTDCSVRRAY
ncbi:transposase [Streptomyces microflavus]|uniref:IS110 family transposase n=1 Tax=Streptomyces microflavus TaxID=1919 RepID=UPI00380E89A1